MSKYHQYYDGSVVFGADPDSYPDYQLKYCFSKKTREYTFINGGFQFGPVESLKNLHQEFRHLWSPGSDDQAFWNWVYVDYMYQLTHDLSDICLRSVIKKRQDKIVSSKLPVLQIDSKAHLIQQMCHNSGHVSFRNNRTYNIYTGSNPVILHFNGGQERHLEGNWETWKNYINDNEGLDTQSIIEGRNNGYFTIMSISNNKFIKDNIPFLYYDDIKKSKNSDDNHQLYLEGTDETAAVFQFVRKKYNESVYGIQSIKSARFMFITEKTGRAVGCNSRKRKTDWEIERIWPGTNRKEFTIRHGNNYLKAEANGDLVIEQVGEGGVRSRGGDRDRFVWKFMGREVPWSKWIKNWQQDPRGPKHGKAGEGTRANTQGMNPRRQRHMNKKI